MWRQHKGVGAFCPKCRGAVTEEEWSEVQSLDRDVQGIVPTIMVATGPRDRARTASFCQAVAQEVQARGIMVRIVALGIAQDPLGDATAMGAAHTAAQLWGVPASLALARRSCMSKARS